MSTLFRVESKDIEGLNDLQLTKLLKLLLHLEARSAGIAERAVEVALNINVRDGGEDGRIQWSGDPIHTDFLPHNFIQFQNKATNMGPADCAKEITNTDGSMKHLVEEVLDNGGAYILFTTQELNKDQKKNERIAKIRKKLEELGKGYAHTVMIDIYDASKIEGWVNKFVPAIVAVLNWVGKPLERGLKTWENWSQHPEYHRFRFVVDENRAAAIKSLRSLLNLRQKCARIIGLSGLGKTRLAYECFKDSEEIDDLQIRVVYLNANANSAALGLVSDWIQCGLEGIVVVDNCDISLHDKLHREVQRFDSKLSLLTLDYNLDRASQTEIIHLKKLPDKLIKEMLEPVYGREIHDLDRIISFAQGFPQMAVLLADARLDREPEMGRLTDDELASKLLWGGRIPSKDDENVLRGCSLFDRFGVEEEVAIEYQFIADVVVGTDLDRFYSCLKRFEERGLIDRRGRFARLVPKPLAIRLAAEWWCRTRPERQIEIIQSEMPGNLIESFCNQISRLDFLPEVKALTEKLCGAQGPFGQAEVILSNRGSRLFRSLVEVNPEATSRVLSKILKQYSNEELFNISGDVRRNLVWALEKLCFHEACFEESANSLLLLASSENESWGNNATGIFKQLFRTFLSGTEAPPTSRLRVIDNALNSDGDTVRVLAVSALEEAICTYSGARSIGAEYQGSGEPLKEWRPKIWSEVFNYWEQALGRLSNLVTERDPLALDAKSAIARNIRGLMQYGRVEVLDNIIKKFVVKDGPLWPEALQSIKDVLQYDADKMPDDGKNKLFEWMALLTPSELSDKLNLIVSNPSYEHEEGEDGHYVNVSAINAKKLAQELASNLSSILPFLENLLHGEQRQAYWFAKNLVEASGNWEPLLSKTISEVETIDEPNISLLLGILNGIFYLDSSQWEAIVDSFTESEKLIQFFPYAITSGKVTINQLDRLIELIGQDKIDAVSANNLVYARPLEHLTYENVSQFVENMASISEKAAWVGLDILFMFCHSDSERWDACKSTFRKILVKLPFDKVYKKQGQLNMYHWHDTTKKLLQDDDALFAVALTRKIVESCSDKLSLGDLWHYIHPVIRILFKQYGKDVWPIIAEAIKEADPLDQYRLMQLLDSGNSFDKKSPSVLADLDTGLLQEWCFQEPEMAPEFVARATDVLLEEGEKYYVSPRAKFLIDNFGDNEHVLSALSANMSSFGWSGSLVPYLQKEVEALQFLKEHKKTSVRSWAKRRIDYLNKMIEREKRRDEEHDWGIH